MQLIFENKNPSILPLFEEMESVTGKKIIKPCQSYLAFIIGIDLSLKNLKALVITCFS